MEPNVRDMCFWLIHMDLSLDLQLNIGKLFKIYSR